jgi:hypothetical protein
MSSPSADRIKVAVRLRPYNKRELELGCFETVSIGGNKIVLNKKES